LVLFGKRTSTCLTDVLFLKGLSGDAHFDDDEQFSTGTADDINLDWVAIHEFGHSLGLEHSGVQESIMYPWYKGYVQNIQLTEDDIKGIQARYPSKPGSSTISATRDSIILATHCIISRQFPLIFTQQGQIVY